MDSQPGVAAPTSRLVHGVLRPTPGSDHLVVADGEGAGAVVDLIRAADDMGLDLRSQAHVIYVPDFRGVDHVDQLQSLGLQRLHRAPSLSAALPRLAAVLGEARMGIQIYVAGSETFLGLVAREVERVGLPHTAIQTEQRGTTARRVQCVHCKGITEDVTVDPVECSHCHLNLMVRDHYSRRLAAFQGVCVDAEDPGQVPAQEVRFR